MLGCVVSLTSSHLSGSTIRDVNNGGSVLCSNSTFSSLLPSPNPNPEGPPTITTPGLFTPDTHEDGTLYSFDADSGGESASVIFTTCRFTGRKDEQSVRPLTFVNYPGTISVLSCWFTDRIIVGSSEYESEGGTILVNNQDCLTPCQPLTVNESNFMSIKTDMDGAGMFLRLRQSATIINCLFEGNGPASTEGYSSAAGVDLITTNSSAVTTITNLVFDSSHLPFGPGGMRLHLDGPLVLSDCLFNDLSFDANAAYAGGLSMILYGETPRQVTRMNFTDCQCRCGASGMWFFSHGDFHMSDIHFLRCNSGDETGWEHAGGFKGSLDHIRTLTVQDCSFVDCATYECGAAFNAQSFAFCVVTDCLVKTCHSGTAGAINVQPYSEYSMSISLSRIAFVNNSVGQNGVSSGSLNNQANTTAFVDVFLNYLKSDLRPSLLIDDCFTTCATGSIGMHMTVNRGTPEESSIRVFDDEFNKIGPLMTEGVEVSFDPLSGRMGLEMNGTIPNPSQKYEVTVQNEDDKTEMNGEIEFVNGKGTLASPSPSLTLAFSTSYTITSIIGIVHSSCSSLSNGLTFPQAAWAFNLAATPSFLTFTTPEQPPTLIGAKAHLVSTDQPLAFVILMLSEEVKGSFEIVVEEEGNDIGLAVDFDESSLLGESSNFVVVGDARLLTHDTTYTIKSITQSPETESPFVWMNETITFHIPESSFDPKKSKLPETKKLLSWLIPLVAKIEVEGLAQDKSNAAIRVEAISHSNFGPDSSVLPTSVEHPQLSKGNALGEMVGTSVFGVVGLGTVPDCSVDVDDTFK